MTEKISNNRQGGRKHGPKHLKKVQVSYMAERYISDALKAKAAKLDVSVAQLVNDAVKKVYGFTQ